MQQLWTAEQKSSILRISQEIQTIFQVKHTLLIVLNKKWTTMTAPLKLFLHQSRSIVSLFQPRWRVDLKVQTVGKAKG